MVASSWLKPMRLHLILALCLTYAVAEPGIFYNPPTGGPIHEYQDDPVYTLGQTVQMRWATTLESFSIMLWQNDNPNYEWIQSRSSKGLLRLPSKPLLIFLLMPADIHGITSYDWIVSTNRNLSHGEVFFFQVRNASNLGNTDQLFASHYFNITKGSSSTTTAVPTTSTRTISTLQTATSTPPLSTSTTVLQSALTTTTSPSLQTEETHGLSGAAKAGVGVGVGLACALAIAFVLFWLHRRKRLHDAQTKDQFPAVSQGPFTVASHGDYGNDGKGPSSVAEAPPNEVRRVFELN
jgi:hypothetical protein